MSDHEDYKLAMDLHQVQEVHKNLSEKLCMCHHEEADILEYLNLSPHVNVSQASAGTSKSYVKLAGSPRDELLLKLSLMTCFAETDCYCTRVKNVQNKLFHEQMEQAWLLVSNADQMIAYSVCKCVKTFLGKLAIRCPSQVHDFLHRAVDSVCNVQETSDPSASLLNRVVFTFNLCTDILQSSAKTVGCGTQDSGENAFPCLTPSSMSEDEEPTLDLPDFAQMCTSACQSWITDLCSTFAIHLGMETPHTSQDISSKTFLAWFRSLDQLSAEKVSYSFFQHLHSLSKHLAISEQHETFLSHVDSVMPHLFTMLTSYCQGNVANLKTVFSIFSLFIDVCIKNMNSSHAGISQRDPVISNNLEELSTSLEEFLRDIDETSWLEELPYYEGPVGFGGSNFEKGDSQSLYLSEYGQGDRTLLRKLSSAIILCLEYLCKSSKCANIHTSSYLQRLSCFINSRLNNIPTMDEDESVQQVDWIFKLFGDQDDALIGTMLSLLRIETSSSTSNTTTNCPCPEIKCNNSSADAQDVLDNGKQDRFCEKDEGNNDISNSHLIFLFFLHHVTWDHSVLLDLLISTETEFLEYLTRYLRNAASDWRGFVEANKRFRKPADEKESAEAGVYEDQTFGEAKAWTRVYKDETCFDCDYSDASNDSGDEDDDSEHAPEFDSNCNNVDFNDGAITGDHGILTKNKKGAQLKDSILTTSNQDFISPMLKRKQSYSNDTCEENQRTFNESDISQSYEIDTEKTQEKRRKVQEYDLYCQEKKDADIGSMCLLEKTHEPLANVNEDGCDDSDEIEDNKNIAICDSEDLTKSTHSNSSPVDSTRQSDTDSSMLDEAMTVLIRLRLSIERLQERNLFPFSAKPLLKLLSKLEDFYEGL